MSGEPKGLEGLKEGLLNAILEGQAVAIRQAATLFPGDGVYSAWLIRDRLLIFADTLHMEEKTPEGL